MHISEPEEQHHFPAHPLPRTAPLYTLPCKGTASGNTVPRITAEGGGAARSPAVQPCPPHRHLGTALRAFDPALLPPLPALPSPARVPACTPVNIAPRAGTDATPPAPGRADRGSPHSPPRTPHSPPELPSLRLRVSLPEPSLTPRSIPPCSRSSRPPARLAEARQTPAPSVPHSPPRAQPRRNGAAGTPVGAPTAAHRPAAAAPLARAAAGGKFPPRTPGEVT